MVCRSFQPNADRQAALYSYKYIYLPRPKPMRYLLQFLILSVVSYSANAVAQRCGATCANAESLLGSSEQTLVGSIPELKRVTKPIAGPRGLRGKWVLPELIFAAQPYTVTYFIGSARVNRIELLSTASKDQCIQKLPFDAALAELARTYGDSHVVGTSEEGGKLMQSVAFNTHAMDVSLYFSSSEDDCSTRVIYKTREVKDASEL